MPCGGKTCVVFGEFIIREALLRYWSKAFSVHVFRTNVRNVALILGHGQILGRNRLIAVRTHVTGPIHVILGPLVESFGLDAPVHVRSELGALEVIVVLVVEEPISSRGSVHGEFQYWDYLLREPVTYPFNNPLIIKSLKTMKSAHSSAAQTPLKRSLLNCSRSQTIEISIFMGEYILALTLPRKTKIAQLNRLVKSYNKLHQIYGPLQSEPVCLASRAGSEIIDYWLLCEDKTLEPFHNKEIFEVVYAPKAKDESPLKLLDFQFKRCLGKGGSCAVYLVRSRRTGYLFALKQIPKEYISDYKRFEQILRQRKILAQLEENLYTIYCHTAFESEKHLNFLTDYYPGGQLFFHLAKDTLHPDSAKIYFCEILSCMEFLHHHNILYRDLKPENILVDIDGHLRIADFGLSRTGFKSEEFAQSYCGSPQYMAPEMVLQTGYSYSLDFYTIGVILYQLMTGRPPYYTEDQDQLFHNIATQEVDYPESLSPSLKHLLQRMLHKDPNRRISSFEEIKNSAWLSDVNWSAIEQRNYKSPMLLDLYSNYIHEEFYEEDVDTLNNANLMVTSCEPLFQFFKFEKSGSKLLLYGVSPHSERALTCCSQSQMKPTALKEPRTLKPNIKFTKNIQPNLSDIKPPETKKKITLTNTKKLQKDHHTASAIGISLSNRNSTSLSKQNNLRHPRIMKSKKTNAKSRDDKGQSLCKEYRTLNKNSSSSKELLKYQTQKRTPTLKSTYKIMLI